MVNALLKYLADHNYIRCETLLVYNVSWLGGHCSIVGGVTSNKYWYQQVI